MLTLLADLAATKAIEVFLNFSVGMAIQRLLLHQPENFTEAQHLRLDDYFGSPDWMQVLYKRRKTLFGDEAQDKINASGVALLNWYRDRLRSIFSHVSKAALIRNMRGGHTTHVPAPFDELHCGQATWPFSTVVLPPSDHATMWSASHASHSHLAPSHLRRS